MPASGPRRGPAAPALLSSVPGAPRSPPFPGEWLLHGRKAGSAPRPRRTSPTVPEDPAHAPEPHRSARARSRRSHRPPPRRLRRAPRPPRPPRPRGGGGRPGADGDRDRPGGLARPLRQPPLAPARAVPGRAGAGGERRSGGAGPLLLRQRQRRRLGEPGHGAHLAADLRRPAHRLDRRAGRGAVEPGHPLRRNRRGRHALGHRPGRRDVPLGRRWGDLDPRRPRRQPADRPHPGPPGGRGDGLRGGARPPVRGERAARCVPLGRRRPPLAEGPGAGRGYRRDRPGLRAGQPAGPLRRPLADAAHAVEHLPAVERPGERSLQVD